MNLQDPKELTMFREPGPAGEQSCWELWRQDDNGVRLLVASFRDREEVLAALARFESNHHKQTYWIEEKGTPWK
jgi:hypothetical protein